MIDFPITDTHVHLLDQKKFKYSWASGAPKLARDWSVKDLEERSSPYEIENIVFVEVDVDTGLVHHARRGGVVGGDAGDALAIKTDLFFEGPADHLNNAAFNLVAYPVGVDHLAIDEETFSVFLTGQCDSGFACDLGKERSRKY